MSDLYPDLVAMAPGWAREATLRAVAATPAVGRAATSSERYASFRAWSELAEGAMGEDANLSWRGNVVRQAIEAGWWCLEVDDVADPWDLARRLRRFADYLKTTIPDLDSASASRAHHALAGVFSTLAEMSLTSDASEDLRDAFTSASTAAATAPAELAPEMKARRHQLARSLALRLAAVSRDDGLLDQAIQHGRLSVGLPPDEEGVPQTLTASPDMDQHELSLRWQGLSIAYRRRGENNADDNDLECAILCAQQSVRLLPVGDPARGGALSALAGALITLADHADDPAPVLDRAVTAYALAAELPGVGSTRRITRLMNLGVALRRRAQSDHQAATKVNRLNNAVAAFETALRLCPSTSAKRPRALCDLANCLNDRASARGSTKDRNQAERLLRRAVKLLSNPPLTAIGDLRRAQAILATHLADANRLIEAGVLFEDSLTHPSALPVGIHATAAFRYSQLLMARGNQAEAMSVLEGAAAEIEQASPSSPFSRDLRNDGLLISVADATNGSVVAASVALPIASDGSRAIIHGSAQGVRLRVADGKWLLHGLPDPDLARRRAIEAREDLQRSFRDEPDRVPDLRTVRRAISAARTVLPPTTEVSDPDRPQVCNVYVEGPAALLPLAAVSPTIPTVIRPRHKHSSESTPWHSGAQWAGIFADDPGLPFVSEEKRALMLLHGSHLRTLSEDDIPGTPNGLALPRFDALHVAAHGVRVRGGFGLKLRPDYPPLLLADLFAAIHVPPIVVLAVCPVAVEESATRSLRSIPEQLLEAGAKAVVAPLWPVRDRAAAFFAQALHTELAAIDSGDVVAALCVATMRARTLQMTSQGEHMGGFGEADWAAWACWG